MPEFSSTDNPNDLLTRLEQARLWSHFHKDWLIQIRQSLREQLPEDYQILVESEAVFIAPNDEAVAMSIAPDLTVKRGGPLGTEIPLSHEGISAAIVEAEEIVEAEQHYSLIIRRAPDDLIVAVLELLSPSNKGVGNRIDRQKHLQKRDEYLSAGVRLLEIDPLLGGSRDLPEPLLPLLSYDRIAWTATHDGDRRRYRGWGWNRNESLPVLDWLVDLNQTVIISLSQTFGDAAAFNHWWNQVPR